MRKLFCLLILVASLFTACNETPRFIIEKGTPAIMFISTKESQIVHTAASIVGRDYKAVFADTLIQTDSEHIADNAPIIAVATCGTEGVYPLLDSIGIDKETLKAHPESYCIGIKALGSKVFLYIVGGDAHGTAYGLMALSRLMGVSPWEWWADSPIKPRERWEVDTFETTTYPAVRYRGIFLNDEDFALIPWANETNDPCTRKGELGPNTYARIFELLMRLQANTCWPAMHECTIPFFFVEGNRETAEKYGIYMGTSHCEPMARNTNGEWRVSGVGDYDYVNNSKEVKRFWHERVEEVANQPIIYTLGMRGVHDGRMNGAKTIDEQREVLTQVLADQRCMLGKLVDSTLTHIPQVFIPYKEVLDVYNSGLSVPEDVTLMWCDDNYGYIRHLPDSAERQRSGGNGLYYHVSYWGRPHDYLWLPSTHPALMATELLRAYDADNREMWILNVGDIKPAEYLTELFMDIAWDPEPVRNKGVTHHMERFMAREFGQRHARAITKLMMDYYHLAYIRRPEFMAHTRTEERDPKYKRPTSLPWSDEFVRNRIKAYEKLVNDCNHLKGNKDEAQADVWYQFIEYPVKAASYMNQKWGYAQLARHGAGHGYWLKADECHRMIVNSTQQYNEEMTNGKWNKMMNYHPRNLAVYDTVPREEYEGTVEHEAYTIGTPLKWERIGAIAELGYSRQAVPLTIGDTLELIVESADSIVLAFVPNHPVQSKEMRVRISLDRHKPHVINIATYGRSETWKRNVKRNLALCPLPFGSISEGRHTLTIEALDPHIILDEVYVLE
ncbi:MAG: hypothetical protein E7091_03380 [Bacteroidales bacterium]|nr:hypothetical protein [Bacteroidales bacterium]